MPRVTVWVPDELHATVRDELPELNWSAAMQRGLSASLECDHRELICRRCNHVADTELAAKQALGRFYGDALAALEPLIHRLGTAEGAARILQGVAAVYGIPGAERIPLPRPSKSQRRRTWEAPKEPAIA
jgi:hypothetical protein